MHRKYIVILCSFIFLCAKNYTPAPQKGVIYLTFEDGPVEGSENVNEVVYKEKINVDVFLVGKNAFLSDANMDRYWLYATNPYIELCNHSYTHKYLHQGFYYLSPLYVYDDFALNGYLFQLNNTICRLPCINIWRLPHRSHSTGKIGQKTADLLAANGARIFGWDLQWDYSPKTYTPIQTPDEMVALVDSLVNYKRTFTPGHIVILCHDRMFARSGQKLKLFEFIGKLKATGNYRFEYLSKYPGADVYIEQPEASY